MRKPFDKIKLSQLHTIYNILVDTKVRDISNIRRKYLEKALAFDETLSFLENLNIVKNNFGELFLSKTFSLSHDSFDDFKKKFLLVLFSAHRDVSEELRIFFMNFQTDTEKIYFKATEIEKIKYSDTRNLLLDLDFITASADNTTYFVNPNYTDLFIKQFSNRRLSPDTFKRKQTENDSIGLAAEKAVIEFEIKRLTNISFDPSEIEHISLENVLAGYDIKSFENYLDINFKKIKRFIEVKAISIQDYKFHWSKNEMEIAKVFGEKYFLYLLPVISNNTFDFKKLMMINNPFKYIYANGLDWKKEEESISFSKLVSE